MHSTKADQMKMEMTKTVDQVPTRSISPSNGFDLLVVDRFLHTENTLGHKWTNKHHISLINRQAFRRASCSSLLNYFSVCACPNGWLTL
jgi:hypothetical protein